MGEEARSFIQFKNGVPKLKKNSLHPIFELNKNSCFFPIFTSFLYILQQKGP